ncbi:hypothetical protein HRH59_17010 [Rheinheimera sp. YQF-2]|uniref:Uncharacterized protein n=1 Tax=Rheinheimera lutimaris TaxID=2740584 RepID=A0A7Y5ATF6_9GAMM|nr:hypothetical protein [Rheinheimera lutimaris]NRQ44245.1 hypothetical protein [Rheinheimera lutimaris]
MPKKHFIIVGDITDGLIIDKDGQPSQAFNAFVEHAIQKDLATNTVKAYAEHVYRFLNYIYRAIEITTAIVDKHYLRQIIYSYSSYLIHGVDSPNELARKIATENKRTKKLQVSSIGPIDNAITYFIRLGELIQSEEGPYAISPLLEAISSPRSLAEKSKMKANSMLAGVLRGGLSDIERVKYGISTLQIGGKKAKQSKKYITRSVDLEVIADVIEASPGNTP